MARGAVYHSLLVQAGMANVPSMKRRMTTALAAAAVSIVSRIAIEATLGGALAAQACVDDWAGAATIIKRRKMVDMTRLHRLARENYSGKIMTIRLCRRNGRYFYHLLILDGSGFAKRIKVDDERKPK
jgi:uncharacterized membrane protein YkoI